MTRVLPFPDDCDVNRSRHAKNAAKVLPLPVGANISVCSPAAMRCQPNACTRVGAGKRCANQAWVTAENAASAEVEFESRATAQTYLIDSISTAI